MLLPFIAVVAVLSRIETTVAVILCETPKHPDNGLVIYTSLHVGSKLTFECYNGYHMQDTRPVYCTSDGEWSKTDVKCVAKTCDPPEQLKNGQVIFTSLTFRSKLKFKCDEGYILESDEPVFCTSDGTWTKTDVKCVVKTCDRPEHPKNGKVVYDSLNFGSQLKFKCDDGYLLNINVPVLCMSDGTWNRTDVRCAEECSVPWIWNGHIEEPQTIYNDRRFFYENVPVGSVRAEGSILYLVCQNDHLVIGLGVSRTSISCIEGKWTPHTVCRKKDCSVPWISNGIIAEEITLPSSRFDRRLFGQEDDNTYKQVPVGSIPAANTTLILVCQENHLVLGLDVNKAKIICSEGKWTPPPVCLKRSCRIPFIPNGRMERLIKIRSSSESRYQFKEIPVGRRAEDGEIFFFLCDQNYRPEDSTSEDPSRVSCRDGEWSREFRCKPNRRIVAPVTSTIPVESASTTEKEIFVVDRLSSTTQIPPTTPKPIQEDCSCTYNSHDRNVSAVVNGVGLWYGDKVKKGDIVILRCQNQENNFVLPNGTRISGSLTFVCDVCRKWEDRDLPSCTVVRSANLVESASSRGKETAVDPSNSRTPNPISSREDTSGGENECFCIYDNPFRSLSAKDYKRLLRYGDKVKRGDSILLKCNDPAMQIVLPNGTKTTSGTFMLICNVCKTWDASQLPTCQNLRRPGIICRDLKASDLMSVTYTNNRRVGSFALFHCFAPGIRSGVSQTQCLENGEWQSSSPTCIVPTCPVASLSEVIPRNVIHDEDDMISSTMPYNSSVKLMCRGGENLVGKSFARCGSEGKWEVGDIRCISGCPPFVMAPGSRLLIKPQKDAYRIGEYVILSCAPGYELSIDVELIMCLQNGWSEGDLPECIKWNVSDE